MKTDFIPGYITQTEAKALGYTIDTHCYPHVAYKGGRMQPDVWRYVFTAREAELRHALEESVKLQSHYATLLNMHDSGQRMTFTADTWLERLTGKPTAEQRPAELRPISDRAMLGMGDEYEERVIDAATDLISRTIGHYSTGDRRFTALMWNVMLHAAQGKR